MQDPNPISTRTRNWVTFSATTEPSSLFPVETEAKLRRMLREQVERDKLPGLVLSVATSDAEWMTAVGKAKQESEVRMQPTDRFRVGHVTTVFVAVVCLQLAEEGRLDLNQPIANYLPKQVSSRLPDSNKIRVRRLLNQTSGLAEVYDADFLNAVRVDPDHNWQTREALEYAYSLKPATIRGAYHYANTNYLLLELIIEQITGKPLAQVIRERIQTPLNLTNTFMELREPIPGGFTQGYQDWNQDGKLDNVTQPKINDGLGLGDRGLVSNATDLTRLFRALFGSDKLLYPYSLDAMLDPTPAGMGDGYGLGISHVVTRWGEAWGAEGQALGFQSVILYFPVHDITLIVWTNRGAQIRTSPLEIADEALGIILGEAN